jgi:hypothetical protein
VPGKSAPWGAADSDGRKDPFADLVAVLLIDFAMIASDVYVADHGEFRSVRRVGARNPQLPLEEQPPPHVGCIDRRNLHGDIGQLQNIQPVKK